MPTAKINPDLEPLARPLADLHCDPKNARKHGKRDLDTIAASLALHGQQKPIVAMRNGKVIAGNGTLEAARALGWDRIACVTYDDEDAAKAAAFAIVDNRSAELSEWGFEALSANLRTLPEDLLAEVGFADFELGPLLASQWEPAKIEDAPDGMSSMPAPPSGRHIVSFTDEQWAIFVRAHVALAGTNRLDPASAVVMLAAAHLGIDIPKAQPKAQPKKQWVQPTYQDPDLVDGSGIRVATADDVSPTYSQHARAGSDLGNVFLMRRVFEDAAAKGELLIHPATGSFCHAHLRKDGTTTIYEIWTSPVARGKGVGRAFLARLSLPIEAKCPEDLPSNDWYRRQGFNLVSVEANKRGRNINKWRKEAT